ncbi:mycofactocin-coupled SDR family oxidoreductase [Nocardioides sp. B-3]|uniref:mycofactocin-coupled SDR family oxidoreductase n=1 Tax=Nocardioides sp. B-3 TaxID=2895565 RepID=UPI0021526E18|nr:mycofactocin-coupled SDR family oxidoreductase [Nocardioides sp. B-3]
MRAAADAAMERWGRLDAAVAGAAVMVGGSPQWETSDADLDTLWGIDVLGARNTAAVAVPLMVEGPDPAGCRFVAVASTAGSRGLFHLAGYTVVKHAVIGLVRGLAADLVGTGVTAVAVSPGATGTTMLEATARIYGLDDAAALAAHQLSRRVHEPDEVAATIAHCCSVAGGLLNGSVLEVGGGST